MCPYIVGIWQLVNVKMGDLTKEREVISRADVNNLKPAAQRFSGY
jgi:hypothetical protein